MIGKTKKVILLSLPPEEVIDILNGHKTAIIMNGLPKCKLPLDVFIHCKAKAPYIIPNPRHGENEIASPSMFFYDSKPHTSYGDAINGTVVARFKLSKVDGEHTGIATHASRCAWHIDNLQITEPFGINNFLKIGWDKGLEEAMEKAYEEDEETSERIWAYESWDTDVANSAELTEEAYLMLGEVKRAPSNWMYAEYMEPDWLEKGEIRFI